MPRLRPFGFRPETRLLPGLDALAHPPLVLCGDRDTQVTPPPARAELRGHPGITLKVLEGADHLFPFEDPGSTAAEITGWCQPDQVGG